MSYIIRNLATKELIRRTDSPLRSDGKLPADLDPSVEVLVEVLETQPNYDKATHKLLPADREEPGAADEPINLIHGWSIVPLNAEELAALAADAAAKTERQEIRAIMADLKAGTGTNGERISRIEKALHRLLKDTLR